MKRGKRKYFQKDILGVIHNDLLESLAHNFLDQTIILHMYVGSEDATRNRSNTIQSVHELKLREDNDDSNIYTDRHKENPEYDVLQKGLAPT